MHAAKLGYTLSDHSLVSFKRYGNEEKDCIVKIKCYCENDILKALGVDYIPPEDRDI